MVDFVGEDPTKGDKMGVLLYGRVVKGAFGAVERVKSVAVIALHRVAEYKFFFS